MLLSSSPSPLYVKRDLCYPYVYFYFEIQAIRKSLIFPPFHHFWPMINIYGIEFSHGKLLLLSLKLILY
jgi:hypothetical protein